MNFLGKAYYRNCEMRVKNVVEYLEDTVKNFPDKSAFIGDNSSLTFKELKIITEKIALFIREKEIFKKPVLVLMEKSPEEVATFLGVIRSGNYYVPMDMEMSETKLLHIISITESQLMICDDFSKKKAEEIGFTGEVYTYREMIVKFGLSNDLSISDFERLTEIRRNTVDTDLVYIVFTSGSTGVPKGVVANHRSVIDYIEELGKVLECSEDTVFGNQAPFYLDACLKDIYTTLKYGATTYVIPKKLFMNPVALIKYLNDNKINTICFVASALTLLTRFDVFEYEIPKYLKLIAFGGEVFPFSHLKKWKIACPTAKFINLYGVTECTGMSSFYVVGNASDTADIPIGKPFPNTDIFLLKDGTGVRKGEKGEICIRGTSLTPGYYKDKKRTAEVFIQNPLNDAYPEIIYKTGDIGYFDDSGNLHFAGRIDNQIKHSGYRVELEEIEKVGNVIEGVNRGICIYNKDRDIIAFIYEGSAYKSFVKKAFRGKIASYMVPSEIIRLEKLPILSGGKIDRRAVASVVSTSYK